MDQRQPVEFVTLGMFIIDDIYPPPSAADQTPKTNIIGGAGTYSAIGARLFAPPPTSSAVGWIVDAGTDFPDTVREELLSWNTRMLLRDRNALTTRGWNGYEANEHRAFKYLTEKKRLTADDLDLELLASRSFHLICSGQRCVEMVQRILARRRAELADVNSLPLIIWEPVPDLCIASEREHIIRALRYVDVLSPNHEELGSIFDFEHGDRVDVNSVERHAAELLESPIGLSTSGAIIVRCSKRGCYVASSNVRKWLPAFHTDSTKVVDPTGGGNGFLGGLAIGLVRSGFDLVEAVRWGSVAASFCIEQVGVPVLHETTVEHNGVEVWNNATVPERLEAFRMRSEGEI